MTSGRMPRCVDATLGSWWMRTTGASPRRTGCPGDSRPVVSSLLARSTSQQAALLLERLDFGERRPGAGERVNGSCTTTVGPFPKNRFEDKDVVNNDPIGDVELDGSVLYAAMLSGRVFQARLRPHRRTCTIPVRWNFGHARVSPPDAARSPPTIAWRSNSASSIASTRARCRSSTISSMSHRS